MQVSCSAPDHGASESASGVSCPRIVSACAGRWSALERFTPPHRVSVGEERMPP
jgi:hypothetical protein